MWCQARSARTSRFFLILEVLEALQLDTSCKVLIIKGEGSCFCSGFDIDEAIKSTKDPNIRGDASKIMWHELYTQQRGLLRRIFRALWESPVISIAQVHGICVESAIGVASMCDIIIAADDAKFFWRSLGGGGMLWHLWPWTIGLRRTKEILFSGEWVTGKEAAQMSMINRSVPLESLEEEVKRWAKKFAEREREFLYADKLSVNKAFEMMGLYDALDNAVLAHVLCHLSEPSKALDKIVRESRTKDAMRDALRRRASAFTRDILGQ